jgi:hypothetical protein
MGPSSADFLRFVNATLSNLASHSGRGGIWGARAIFVAVILLTRARRRTTYRSLMSSIVADTAAALGLSARPSVAGLSQARQRLDVDTCRAILRAVADRLAAMTPKRFLHPSGRRFIGIDGVRFATRRTKETVQRFQMMSASRWVHSHCPQAVVVVAVDLMRRLPLDFALLPKGSGERAGAAALLAHFRPGDVAVMDRGFPAKWLLQAFTKTQIDVVVRMTSGMTAWAAVDAFLRSGMTEQAITLPCGKDGPIITGRLIRRNFRRGRPARGQKAETQVIFTTLPAAEFDRSAVIDLYAARWGIETIFREMKCEFDAERFHAHSVNGIMQEIAAILAWIGFASAVQRTAEATLPDGRRVLRTLCFDEATKLMEAVLAGRDIERLFTTAIANVCAYHYAPKPGRSYPRERKAPIGRFSIRRAR